MDKLQEWMRPLNSTSKLSHVSLARARGTTPAVRVQTAKTVRFSSKPVQKHNPLHLGGPTLDPYPSVPISGSSFRVFLCMVTFRYLIATHKILTIIYRPPVLIYWPPLYSQTSERGFLLHPEHESQGRENECQQSLNDYRSRKSDQWKVNLSLW